MCSYCGCDSIECIGRFMDEHVDLINRTGQLRRACAAADPQGVVAAATAVDELLGPHSRAEEAGLFAVLAEDEEFAEHIESLCQDHRDLDRLLALISSGAHENFGAFEHAMHRHLDREDNGLFPAAAIRLAGPEWERVHDLTPSA
ncbi:MAG: hemerythrin domain-containing protein [Dermatophilaceae bacterium]